MLIVCITLWKNWSFPNKNKGKGEHMRLTMEQLIEKFPSWNHAHSDIVAVNYGDVPAVYYTQEKYQEFRKLAGTLANINAVDAYIYEQYGNYRKYNTFAGTVYVKQNGEVLAGSVNVKYGGKYYSILLNQMYGYKKLDVLRIGVGNVVGFSNKDGQGSPSIYTKEIEVDLLERILNDPMEDYGIAIQCFMKIARELYEEDRTNYILEKCKKK